MKYIDYNDYELLDYISDDNEEARNILFEKYEPLINNISHKMLNYTHNTGLELSDLIQEGMLGLSNAMEHFKESKETLFYTYAKLCIERKILDLVIASRRQKHKVLNESISFEFTDDEGNESNFEYLLKDNSENPEIVLLNDENEEEFIRRAKEQLTPFEQSVFELKINGFDYKEISEILDKTPKAIDNALQRIKTKLKKVLD